MLKVVLKKTLPRISSCLILVIVFIIQSPAISSPDWSDVHEKGIERVVHDAIDIPYGPPSLDHYAQLESLKIPVNTYTNLYALKLCPNLTELEVYMNPIDDLTPIASLKKLEKLTLSENTFDNLDPLAWCASLKHLVIMKNSAPDLTPLANLQNLETLKLSSTTVADLKSLMKLPKLKILILNDNRIKNLSPVVKMRSLESLEFSHFNYSIDTSMLYGLKNLKQLQLNHERIKLH